MKDKKLARSITRLASGYGIVSDLPKEKPIDSINPEHYKSGDIECENKDLIYLGLINLVETYYADRSDKNVFDMMNRFKDAYQSF
mgnify:CR=1 FL=1